MTETEASKSGRKILVGTRPMTQVGRAVERGETKGFMKIIADADTEGDCSARHRSAPAATRSCTAFST